MQIDLLARHPQHLPQVAQWCAQSWPDYYSNGDIEVAKRFHSRTLRTDRVPLGLIALDGERLIGTVTLLEEDMDIRPIYTPWLGCLYVDPEYRGQSVAQALINAAVNNAADIGVPCLFVWSEMLGPAFARRGWQVLERVQFRGKEVAILCCCPRKICSTNPAPLVANA